MRFLFFFLFCCTMASGQTLLFPKDSAFIKEVDGLPAKEPFDTAHSYRQVVQPYIYIISGHDMYNLFGYDTFMKYRDFDFANNHILGSVQCRQCLMYCQHDEGQTACHRNRCSYGWIWLMRDNKKAFIEISSTIVPGHVDADMTGQRKSFVGDTIIASRKDHSFSNWYTHGQGDCFATFKYNIYADKYHPILLLKERNYWGGCRAGGFWDFTISFKMPPDILHHSKIVVLMEKNNMKRNEE
ncbi:MAG: hypothetical protein HZB42_06730 [Sphingobacteriales bacterium]|nr:hypothetical protein [Sphingobacteriales bacterium]